MTQAIMLVLPLTSSFALLVSARLLQILSLGAFCTADASLIVYMLGPEKSRSVAARINGSLLNRNGLQTLHHGIPRPDWIRVPGGDIPGATLPAQQRGEA